ncbi:hypothetical protein [Eoetvoesiella caeni]|uniref:hypothetical protein n=1 Tax=Eoetvoesiella caeni TaxID=645616 RepID=UPI001475A4A5|nr:hypothetical protein [Eoetvoesiella caeni]MCI2810360.1 hypothetical protein [Eoetvoesiella caeni]NYT54729.1 hypothetical protein [Eoetvoesiella caeni]
MGRDCFKAVLLEGLGAILIVVPWVLADACCGWVVGEVSRLLRHTGYWDHH